MTALELSSSCSQRNFCKIPLFFIKVQGKSYSLATRFKCFQKKGGGQIDSLRYFLWPQVLLQNKILVVVAYLLLWTVCGFSKNVWTLFAQSEWRNNSFCTINLQKPQIWANKHEIYVEYLVSGLMTVTGHFGLQTQCDELIAE